MYHGSCLCKAVQFGIDGDIKSVTHCHCKMCQKSHASAYATYAATPKENFKLTGEENLACYESSPGVKRTFCKHCGSQIQWIDNNRWSKEWATFSLALLDADIDPRKQQHIYLASKVPWLKLCDHFPKHLEASMSAEASVPSPVPPAESLQD
ncbi:GFA family protein [Sansalvadorimonas sp. 2012CJ34-2]|uniref:GFA family protein n=1 Tax=Parendozoicomonas callyspongiae TaxID=2942213 RepID=A0ABT0PEV6_9GAMM|nr:GFA family protein [Sansalvadorimonas sp. 2012CJ34-2]MCL6269531.1 GFA family protein [Sansalvadorimonas sp. 2012CJ34-2]